VLFLSWYPEYISDLVERVSSQYSTWVHSLNFDVKNVCMFKSHCDNFSKSMGYRYVKINPSIFNIAVQVWCYIRHATHRISTMSPICGMVGYAVINGFQLTGLNQLTGKTYNKLLDD